MSTLVSELTIDHLSKLMTQLDSISLQDRKHIANHYLRVYKINLSTAFNINEEADSRIDDVRDSSDPAQNSCRIKLGKPFILGVPSYSGKPTLTVRPGMDKSAAYPSEGAEDGAYDVEAAPIQLQAQEPSGVDSSLVIPRSPPCSPGRQITPGYVSPQYHPTSPQTVLPTVQTVAQIHHGATLTELVSFGQHPENHQLMKSAGVKRVRNDEQPAKFRRVEIESGAEVEEIVVQGIQIFRSRTVLKSQAALSRYQDSGWYYYSVATSEVIRSCLE